MAGRRFQRSLGPEDIFRELCADSDSEWEPEFEDSSSSGSEGEETNKTFQLDAETPKSRRTAGGMSESVPKRLKSCFGPFSQRSAPAPATSQVPATAPATPHEPVTTPATQQMPVAVTATQQKPVAAPATPHEPVTTPATQQMPMTTPATQQKLVTAPATPHEPMAIPATPQAQMPVTTPAAPHESVTTMASPHVSVTAPASPHESVTTPATPQMPAAAPATQQKPVMAPATQQVPVMASPTHGISTATASNRDDAVRTWRQMEPDDAVTQRAFKGAQAPHSSVRGESVDIIIKAIFNDDFWELLVRWKKPTFMQINTLGLKICLLTHGPETGSRLPFPR